MLTICSLVARAGGSEDIQVQAMADRLVEYARFCMKDRKRVSPFQSTFIPKVLNLLSFHLKKDYNIIIIFLFFFLPFTFSHGFLPFLMFLL